MTHQEQAKELIERFRTTEISYYEAKQCALIAVDLIINELERENVNGRINHWQAVKTEIEKL